MYKLKPLKWTEYFSEAHYTESPTHYYAIKYDSLEKSYVVVYKEKSTNQTGKKYVKTIEEGKQWCEEVHTPSKLTQWFEVINDTTTITD